jgi:hypothetical protein
MKTVLLGLIMLVEPLVVAKAQPVCPDGSYVSRYYPYCNYYYQYRYPYYVYRYPYSY